MNDDDGFLTLLGEGDPIWSRETGMCGGCARVDCHEGPCPSDPCRACAARREDRT